MNLTNNELQKCFIALAKGNDNFVDMVLAKKSFGERVKRAKINRIKRLKRERITMQPWDDLTLKEKAKFIAKWEWDAKRKAWVRKDEPSSAIEVEKNLKIKIKRMKRLAPKLARLGKRVKRVQLAKMVKAMYEDIGVLFINLSSLTNPDESLASLLSKTKKDKIAGSTYLKIKKYFTDPQSVQAYKINNAQLVVVTEGFGMYSVIAKKDFLKKLKKGVFVVSKNNGVTADADIISIKEMGKSFLPILDDFVF